MSSEWIFMLWLYGVVYSGTAETSMDAEQGRYRKYITYKVESSTKYVECSVWLIQSIVDWRLGSIIGGLPCIRTQTERQ